MIEAGIAVLAVYVCWELWAYCWATPVGWVRDMGVVLSFLAGTYFVVRFIHWSWGTPVPFAL